MKFVQLGKTNYSVSALGFGLMRLPLNKTNPDFEKAGRLIRHALETGINFFDVGTFYCEDLCEQAFGQAVRNLKDEKLIIAGKNATHQSGRDNWTAQSLNTLKLFHKNYFDIYFLHYLSCVHWEDYYIKKRNIAEIEHAMSSGQIKHLGFSSHDEPADVKYLIDTEIFEAVILPYNLLNRKFLKARTQHQTRLFPGKKS